MSDERPPLSTTDDPFELLGAPPEADERTLKRAYARLIRIYRPDACPNEFARIHEAFDLARSEGGGRLAPMMPARTRTSGPAGDEPPPPHDLGPDPVGDDEPPVFYGPPLPPLPLRFARLVDQGRFDELWAFVQDPQLLDAASEDPAVAALLLRTTAVLTWRFPNAALHIARLVSIGSAPPYAIELAEREAVLARRFHQVRRLGVVRYVSAGQVVHHMPAELYDLVANSLLATPAGRRQSCERAAWLLREPRLIQQLCNQLWSYDAGLARAFAERLRDELEAEYPASRRAALDTRLRSVERFGRLFRFGAALLATLLVLVGTGVWASRIEAPEAVVVPGASALVGIAAFYYTATRKRYVRRVRARLLEVALDLAVPVDEIVAWVDIAPAGRTLRHFLPQIRNDIGLALLGAFAALMREQLQGDG